MRISAPSPKSWKCLYAKIMPYTVFKYYIKEKLDTCLELKYDDLLHGFLVSSENERNVLKPQDSFGRFDLQKVDH